MTIKRVLIVDDNEINRMLLYSLLENYEEENAPTVHFTINEAANGLEAVIMAEDKGFDLILMDINMPGIDGIEATHRIRSHNPTSVIIAVSGLEDEIMKKAIMDNGADGYIPKPVDPEVLYGFVRRLLGY